MAASRDEARSKVEAVSARMLTLTAALGVSVMRVQAGVVFVLDEAADARRELASLLPFAPFRICICSSTVELLAARRPDAAGCIILDLSCLNVSGLELQAMLTRAGCRCPFIFLIGAGDIPACVAAMKAGAVTVLTKPVQAAALRAAIDEALRMDELKRLEQSHWAALERRVQTLTPRERQVLEHVVAGLLNKQIAAVLGTTVKTIKVHRARVMQKMHVRSLAELVRVAVCMGLVHGMRYAA